MKLEARRRTVAAIIMGALVAAVHFHAPAQELTNYFNDPFAQITSGLPGCPVPRGPLVTSSEIRTEAHSRAERGTRCYLSGACRLPNSYLYDKDIAARMRQHVLYDGRFSGTSVWVLVQRRWVILQGCVRTKAQSEALSVLAREVDDVEAVVDELMIGARGTPKYRTAASIQR
ncbi:MAG TPA: BON domain-containing protein [Casimicrobiaceae bacterium]|nr:BON domain-containing protein [Casimicrobiaceae bacterium]